MINDLMNLVAAEKDGAGHDFLEWFCREQVEEEAQRPVDRRPTEAGRRQRRGTLPDRPGTRQASASRRHRSISTPYKER